MTYDTNYPELGHTLQGIVLWKIALTSDTSCNLGGPQATLTSDQLAINSGVFTTPCGSIIHDHKS